VVTVSRIATQLNGARRKARVAAGCPGWIPFCPRTRPTSCEREALAYLIEENRLLRRQLGGQRLRLTDDDRDGSPRALSGYVRTHPRRWRTAIVSLLNMSGRYGADKATLLTAARSS
jgi:hypothetical protein